MRSLHLALIPAVLLTLVLPFTGCFDGPGEIQGYNVRFASHYYKNLYFEAWNDESHPARAEIGAKGTNENSAHNPIGFLFGCTSSMTEGYLKVVLKDISEGISQSREIQSKTWNHLQCGEKYTIIIDEQADMSLYDCDPCEGDEPALPWE